MQLLPENYITKLIEICVCMCQYMCSCISILADVFIFMWKSKVNTESLSQNLSLQFLRKGLFMIVIIWLASKSKGCLCALPSQCWTVGTEYQACLSLWLPGIETQLFLLTQQAINQLKPLLQPRNYILKHKVVKICYINKLKGCI